MKKFSIIITLIFSTYFLSVTEAVKKTAQCTPSQLSADLQEIKSELEGKAGMWETRLRIQQIDTILRKETADIESVILSLQLMMIASSVKSDKIDLKLEKLATRIQDAMSTMNSTAPSVNQTLIPINDTVTLDARENLESKVALGPDASQNLTVEYLSTKLPEHNSCPTPFYDGGDNIYLFRGRGSFEDDILKFSISSETLVQVGSIPLTIRGTAQADKHGRIFYFGSFGGRHIHKFDPVTNETTAVNSSFEHDISNSISIKVNSTFVIIFGGDGRGRQTIGYDMEEERDIILPAISHNFNHGSGVRVGKKVYLFDDTETAINQAAMAWDVDSNRILTVGPHTLPIFGLHPSTVWDENGRNIYIIGGYNSTSGYPTGGLIQFNPATYQNKFIPVQNYPVQGLAYFREAPASVFVPSANKIYFFGGESFNYSSGESTTHDKIFTIDLTPLTLTTTIKTTEEVDATPVYPQFFSCANQANGTYPHDSDCSAFLGCHNETMTIFNCPSPLHFNPKNKSCEKVKCSTSCKDRPDGSYPHPHDCSLFIICRSEVLNVFKCPPPLLFGPGNLRCDFPNAANCSIALN